MSTYPWNFSHNTYIYYANYNYVNFSFNINAYDKLDIAYFVEDEVVSYII